MKECLTLCFLQSSLSRCIASRDVLQYAPNVRFAILAVISRADSCLSKEQNPQITWDSRNQSVGEGLENGRLAESIAAMKDVMRAILDLETSMIENFKSSDGYCQIFDINILERWCIDSLSVKTRLLGVYDYVSMIDG
jgi:hypothetical protein